MCKLIGRAYNAVQEAFIVTMGAKCGEPMAE